MAQLDFFNIYKIRYRLCKLTRNVPDRHVDCVADHTIDNEKYTK